MHLIIIFNLTIIYQWLFDSQFMTDVMKKKWSRTALIRNNNIWILKELILESSLSRHEKRRKLPSSGALKSLNTINQSKRIKTFEIIILGRLQNERIRKRLSAPAGRVQSRDYTNTGMPHPMPNQWNINEYENLMSMVNFNWESSNIGTPNRQLIY